MNLTTLAIQMISQGSMNMASLVTNVKPGLRMTYKAHWALMKKVGSGQYVVQTDEGEEECSSGVEAKILVVEYLVGKARDEGDNLDTGEVPRKPVAVKGGRR